MRAWVCKWDLETSYGDKISFTENINSLAIWKNRYLLNSVTNNVMQDEVTITLNVFSVLVKDVLLSNLDCTLIITMKRYNGKMTDAHIYGNQQSLISSIWIVIVKIFASWLLLGWPIMSRSQYCTSKAIVNICLIRHSK